MSYEELIEKLSSDIDVDNAREALMLYIEQNKINNPGFYYNILGKLGAFEEFVNINHEIVGLIVELSPKTGRVRSMEYKDMLLCVIKAGEQDIEILSNFLQKNSYFLMSFKAFPNNYSQLNIFDLAIIHQKNTVVKFLVTEYPKFLNYNNFKSTIKHGDFEIIEFLLDKDPKLIEKCNNESNIFDIIKNIQNIVTLEFLLEKGLNVESINTDNSSAFYNCYEDDYREFYIQKKAIIDYAKQTQSRDATY